MILRANEPEVPDVTDTFTQQRLIHLGSLAAELSERGLSSRVLGRNAPVLWVWDPGSGSQTIVFATPTSDGWFFLWSPDGQECAKDSRRTAEALKGLLGGSP
ncbi:hypothetical protein GCM10017673_33530 [Streptosporangium violaceochromogenes]|nr:hypothetical protein GCM10017673_33530 [Streptosporangium violaceochromogenes]